MAFAICSPGVPAASVRVGSCQAFASLQAPAASRAQRQVRSAPAISSRFEVAGRHRFFGVASDIAAKPKASALAPAQRGFFVLNDGANGAGAGAAPQADPQAIAAELMSRLMTARMISVTSSLLSASRSELMLENGVHLAVAQRLGSAHGGILRLLHPESRTDFMRTVAASGSLNLNVPEPKETDPLDSLLATLRGGAKEEPSASRFADAVEAFSAAVEAGAEPAREEGPGAWAEEDGALIESIAEGMLHGALREEDIIRGVTALGTLRQAKLDPYPPAERDAYAKLLSSWLRDCSGMGDNRAVTLEHLVAGHLSALGFKPEDYPLRDPAAAPREPNAAASVDQEGEEVMRLAVVITAALASRAAGTTDDEQCLKQLNEAMEGLRAVPNSGFGESRTELASVMAGLLEMAARPLGAAVAAPPASLDSPSFLPEDEPPCTSLGALGAALRQREAHPLAPAMGDLVDRLFPMLVEEPGAAGAGEEGAASS
eukprot:tig00020553_g10699.t1